MMEIDSTTQAPLDFSVNIRKVSLNNSCTIVLHGSGSRSGSTGDDSGLQMMSCSSTAADSSSTVSSTNLPNGTMSSAFKVVTPKNKTDGKFIIYIHFFSKKFHHIT